MRLSVSILPPVDTPSSRPTAPSGLSTYLTSSTIFTFDHSSYELVQVSLSLQSMALQLFSLYRPPLSRKSKLTESMFPNQLSDLLDHCNSLHGDLCASGDFNAHFDLPHNLTTTKLLDLLRMFNLHQTVKQPTQRQGHVIDLVKERPDDGV